MGAGAGLIRKAPQGPPPASRSKHAPLVRPPQSCYAGVRNRRAGFREGRVETPPPPRYNGGDVHEAAAPLCAGFGVAHASVCLHRSTSRSPPGRRPRRRSAAAGRRAGLAGPYPEDHRPSGTVHRLHPRLAQRRLPALRDTPADEGSGNLGRFRTAAGAAAILPRIRPHRQGPGDAPPRQDPRPEQPRRASPNRSAAAWSSTPTGAWC